jgi:DNA-binding transcriptional ArsR family regulator
MSQEQGPRPTDTAMTRAYYARIDADDVAGTAAMFETDAAYHRPGYDPICTTKIVQELFCIYPPSMTASPRAITDSRILAAMAHPLRRRLLDSLTVDGPSTASMLADRTGQAVGNISHHMKVLSQAALVGEAPQLARDRRERWWQVSDKSRRWSSTSFDHDPAAAAVADAAASLGLDHHADKVRAWHAERETADTSWINAAFSTDAWLRLTSAELREVSEQITSLLGQWRDRRMPDDVAERQPVFVFAHGIPATP